MSLLGHERHFSDDRWRSVHHLNTDMKSRTVVGRKVPIASINPADDARPFPLSWRYRMIDFMPRQTRLRCRRFVDHNLAASPFRATAYLAKPVPDYVSIFGERCGRRDRQPRRYESMQVLAERRISSCALAAHNRSAGISGCCFSISRYSAWFKWRL
jgi:hypothetical protein